METPPLVARALALAESQGLEAWLHHPLLTTIEPWVTLERRALISVLR